MFSFSQEDCKLRVEIGNDLNFSDRIIKADNTCRYQQNSVYSEGLLLGVEGYGGYLFEGVCSVYILHSGKGVHSCVCWFVFLA